MHDAGLLVRRQPLARELQHRLGVEVVGGLDERGDGLAPLLGRRADDGGVDHGGVRRAARPRSRGDRRCSRR